MVSSTEGEAIASLAASKAARIAKIRANTTAVLKLRTTDLKALAGLLARNCVKRGTRWLNRNAPNPGWWRNCLDGGRSRVRMSHDNSGILALAFEYERNMTDEFGYVTDAVVLRKIGFGYSSREADRLGFSPGFFLTGYTPYPKHYPKAIITPELLDKAWASFLENPPSMWRCNYRHPSNTDRAFARSGKEPWWRPMLIAFSRMGRDARARA